MLNQFEKLFVVMFKLEMWKQVLPFLFFFCFLIMIDRKQIKSNCWLRTRKHLINPSHVHKYIMLLIKGALSWKDNFHQYK